MSIECYDTTCPFHSCHHEVDTGPFCDESEYHCESVLSEVKKKPLKKEEELDPK